MKTLEQRLSDILLDVYETANNPAHWKVMLQGIATEMEATKASMHVHAFARQTWAKHTAGSRLHSLGYDESTTAMYASYYAIRDPYVQRIRERFPRFGVGTSDDLITSTELRRTEFYADYGRPNNIFFVSWTVVEQNERFASGLALIRPEDATQFTCEQVSLLTLLTPHLAKSFRLQRVIERATANNQAVLSSVAQFDFAVIALDYDGRITNISAPAKVLLDAQDGVRVRAARLRAAYAGEDILLQDMLGAAARAWEDPHRMQRNTLLLTRQSGKRPLQVVVFPFAPANSAGGLLADDRPRILVLLSDPSAPPPSRAAVLRSLYGLTKTEARLADLVLQGFDVRKAATQMKIALGTAQDYLKQIFEKTDTHRQQDLMRLMLSLPGNFEHASAWMR